MPNPISPAHSISPAPCLAPPPSPPHINAPPPQVNARALCRLQWVQRLTRRLQQERRWVQPPPP